VPQTTDVVPVTHSIVATQTLMDEVGSGYRVGHPIECRLLQRGLNDTYLVRTMEERYILRLYRTAWRTPADVFYELDMLVHLRGKGLAVSTPLPRRDGTLASTLLCPEGVRLLVLFTYAQGDPPAWPQDEEFCRAYGRAAAAIHTGLDDFASPHARFALDLHYLIDQPLHTIVPLLNGRAEDVSYLHRLADRLRTYVGDVGPTLEYGACHGDFNSGNCSLADGVLTFFDFDCCGPGWRVFDLATFAWNMKLAEQPEALSDAFLSGYAECRPIAAADLAALPYFVLIRHIWLLGLHTANGQDWGFGWLDRGYMDNAMKFLRDWEAEHLDGRPAQEAAPPTA